MGSGRAQALPLVCHSLLAAPVSAHIPLRQLMLRAGLLGGVGHSHVQPGMGHSRPLSQTQTTNCGNPSTDVPEELARTPAHGALQWACGVRRV